MVRVPETKNISNVSGTLYLNSKTPPYSIHDLELFLKCFVKKEVYKIISNSPIKGVECLACLIRKFF